MPGNVLTATIKVNTQGVKQSFQEVSTGTKKAAADFKSFDGFATGAIAETRQVVKSLKLEIAGLDQQLLNSRGGRALSSELALAKNELKALEKQANISGAATGNTLTKGFSALRQLAFILPGIGIAGIFNVVFEGIGKLADSFSALPAAAATVADFNEKFAAGAGKDIALLELLKAKINDSNTTQKQRVELVKDYNKEADRGNQIDVTQIGNIDLINEKILQQIALLKERAKVKAAENVIAGKFEELFKRELDVEVKFPGLNDVLAKATHAVEAANEKLKIKPSFDVKELLALVDLPQSQLDNLAKGADRLKALGDPEVVKRLQNANRELAAFFNTVGGKRAFTSSSQKIFLDQAEKDVDDTLKLFAKLLTVEGFSEKEKERVAKIFEGIQVSVVKGLNDTVNLLEIAPHKLSLPFQVVLDENKLTTQFSFVNEQLRVKLQQFALKASSVPLNIKQAIEIDPNLTIPAKLRQEIEAKIKSGFPSGIPLTFQDVEIDGVVKIVPKVDTEALLQQLNQEISTVLQELKIGLAVTIGEGIGDAITGKGVQDAFKSLFDLIGNGMRQIGIALIKYGIQAKIAQLAIKSLNPGLAIAAGIALIALSQALKNSLGREKGGPVSKGKMYEVNERGRELFQPSGGKPYLITGGRQYFTPPTSGKIIPNWQTEKILKTASLGNVRRSMASSFAGFSGHRASGGAVVAGNNYIVNERGREIFIPNTGQAINVNQPSASFGRGGISVSVTGGVEIAGNKLIAVLANAQRTQKVFV